MPVEAWCCLGLLAFGTGCLNPSFEDSGTHPGRLIVTSPVSVTVAPGQEQQIQIVAKNVSSAPSAVSAAKVSCGCLKPAFQPTTIPAFSEVFLRFNVTGNEEVGVISRRIELLGANGEVLGGTELEVVTNSDCWVSPTHPIWTLPADGRPADELIVTFHHPPLRTQAEAIVEDSRFWVRNEIPGEKRSSFCVGLEDHRSVAENDEFNITFKTDVDGLSRSIAVRFERERFGAFSYTADSSPTQNRQSDKVMFITNPHYHEASRPVTFVSKSSQVKIVSVNQSGAIYFLKLNASDALSAGQSRKGVLIEAALGEMIVPYTQ